MYEERVAAALAALRDRWGSVPTRVEPWPVDRVTYDATRDRAERGTVGGAGGWVTRTVDEQREALLVREQGVEGWSEPAGKQRPGEKLAATARREVREETGVRIRLDGVRLATRAIHTHEDRPPVARLIVVFDATPVGSGAEPARDEEIAAVRWFREHPAELRYPAVASFPI